MDEYFNIDRLKSDFFKAVALEHLNADPDTDFDTIESVSIPVDEEKEVTVTRNDIFTKMNKGAVKYFVPDIQRPIPEILTNLLYFCLCIRDKENKEHPKLLVTLEYGQQLEVYWAYGYEPGNKTTTNDC